MRRFMKLLPLLGSAVLSLGLTCLTTTFGAWESYHHCEFEGPDRFYLRAPVTVSPERHRERVGNLFVTCEVTDQGAKPGFQLVLGSVNHVEEPGERSYTLEVRKPPREYQPYPVKGAEGVYAAVGREAWGLISIMASRRGETLQVRVWPEDTPPGRGAPLARVQVRIQGFRKALKNLRKRDCSLFPKPS